MPGQWKTGDRNTGRDGNMWDKHELLIWLATWTEIQESKIQPGRWNCSHILFRSQAGMEAVVAPLIGQRVER